MGIEVELTINTDVAAELAAAKHEALRAGGEVIRAASAAKTPVLTGELLASAAVDVAGQVAAISYRDWKAVIVHENMYDHHEHGHAKFLELAAAEKADAAYGEMAQVLSRVFL